MDEIEKLMKKDSYLNRKKWWIWDELFCCVICDILDIRLGWIWQKKASSTSNL